MRANVRLNVPPAWPNIRLLRFKVGEALEDYPDDLRTAAMMAASELMENAIKYGEAPPSAPEIGFSMIGDAERVSIEVANGSTQTSARVLRERVAELSRVADKRALYVERLTWLLVHPAEAGQLGLYRIAYEGRFDLDASYSGGIVTVIARRGVR